MEYKQTSINIKFNDTTIKVEYTFDDNKQCNKTIKVNETETKNDLHKDIFKLIEEYAQDILYYDDFMFSMPNVVRFSPKNELKNDPDNFFNSKLNKD